MESYLQLSCDFFLTWIRSGFIKTYFSDFSARPYGPCVAHETVLLFFKYYSQKLCEKVMHMVYSPLLKVSNRHCVQKYMSKVWWYSWILLYFMILVLYLFLPYLGVILLAPLNLQAVSRTVPPVAEFYRTFVICCQEFAF